MHKCVAPLDTEFLKVRGKLVSSDLPKQGFLPCSVSHTFSHNEMEFRAPRNDEQLQGFRQPVLPPHDSAELHLDISGLLQSSAEAGISSSD